MPRPDYPFLAEENKAKRKEFLEKLVPEINKIYQAHKIDKTITVDDLLAKCEDPKKMETYKKCQDFAKEDAEKKAYTQSLLQKYNIKTLDGFHRTEFYSVTIPKEDDPNKEEIERQNVEILRRQADPKQLKGVLKEMLHNAFTTDMTAFFPENSEEAINTMNANRYLYACDFALESIYQNGGMSPNPEIEGQYKYYKSMIENSTHLTDYIDKGASEFDMFMPDDFTVEMICEFATPASRIADQYTDILKVNDQGLCTSYTSYMTASLEINPKKEFDKYCKTMLQKYVKTPDFMMKHIIGGDTFEEQMKIHFELGHEELPIFNSDITDKMDLEDYTLPQINVYHALKKRDQIVEEIASGKTLKDYNNIQKNSLEAISLYLASEQLKDTNENAREIFESVGNDMIENNISQKKIDAFRFMKDHNIDCLKIKSIGNNGIVFNDRIEKSVKIGYEFPIYTSSSTKELRTEFDYLKGKDFKENANNLLEIAKATKERYKERGFFSRIFSGDAWRERAIMSGVEKLAVKNGISKEAYQEFLSSNVKNIVQELGIVSSGLVQEEPAKEDNTMIKVSDEPKKENVVVTELEDEVLDVTYVEEKDEQEAQKEVSEERVP